MNSNIIARVALASTLVLAAALPLRAQAPAASTTFTFLQPDGTIISQRDGLSIKGNQLVTLSVLIQDPTGLKSATLSGPRGSSSVVFSGSPSASLGLLWSTTSSPAGDYKFTSSARNAAGQSSNSSITVHLVK